ncbi:cupin domain-containing protein [Skermanella pratensis]|uniref:cupin domain-containing protein n=1 Tax=Skermanella pratensis TaxID=2233999 RepID=UPI0013017871|nr:cupin domain-containing protein [Skermanella pratensis]
METGSDQDTKRGSDVFLKDAEIGWETVGEGLRRKILCYDETIMMARVAFEAGAIGTPHRHPHTQCSLVESGVFDITIAGRTERLSAGDSFVVPSDALHGAVNVEPGILLDVFTPLREDFLPPA